MLQWWDEFAKRPYVAHMLRAVDRFNVRGGAQLAAAITYFSVLALVPILMLLFAVLGFTATVFRPELLGLVEDWINKNFPADSDFGPGFHDVVLSALTNWGGFFATSLLISAWIGSGWVGNTKRAVRLLMRQHVDDPGKQLIMPLDILVNFAGLLGVLVGLVATFASTTVASTLGGTVGEWLGVGGSFGWTSLIRLVGAMVSLAIGALGFRMLFSWFSPTYVPRHLAWVGAAIGSAGLLILQALAAFLFGLFANNLGIAVFGSTIVLMIFLNLFATLILFIAAWLATSAAPAVPEAVQLPQAFVEPVENKPGELYVSSHVAERSLGIGLGTGYVIGAATGVGIGAAIVAALARMLGRRR